MGMAQEAPKRLMPHVADWTRPDSARGRPLHRQWWLLVPKRDHRQAALGCGCSQSTPPRLRLHGRSGLAQRQPLLRLPHLRRRVLIAWLGPAGVWSPDAGVVLRRHWHTLGRFMALHGGPSLKSAPGGAGDPLLHAGRRLPTPHRPADQEPSTGTGRSASGYRMLAFGPPSTRRAAPIASSARA